MPELLVILAAGYAEPPLDVGHHWQKLSNPSVEASLKLAIAKLLG